MLASNPTADEAYGGLIPWNQPDEAMGWPLFQLVLPVTSGLEEVNAVVRDREHIGWSSIMDADRVPANVVPWLAQFIGVEIDPRLDLTTQRQALKETAGFRRGTKMAIAGAARKHLTGTKAVQIVERDGSAYRFTVKTFARETPDRDAVEAELIAAKPAGLLMTYEVIEGQTYGELRDTGDTYSQLAAEYPTYFDMTTSVPPST